MKNDVKDFLRTVDPIIINLAGVIKRIRDGRSMTDRDIAHVQAIQWMFINAQSRLLERFTIPYN